MDVIKRKKVLITGGSGFLGSHLINKLIGMDAEIYSIDIFEPFNPILQDNLHKFLFFKIDLSENIKLIDLVNKINPDYIYHIAGDINRERINIDLVRLINNNITSTVNLLSAMRNIDYKKFIFISTGEVYDYNKNHFVNENSTLNPVSPYSASKLASEIFCRTLSEIYKKDYLILRLFNFYGEGQSPKMFIPQIINAAIDGKDFEMTFGEQTRDFTYIGDIVEAIIHSSFSENVKNDILNVGSGREIKIKELAEKINKLMKNTIKIKYGALQYNHNEIWRMCCDNSKIRELIGWYPKISLDEGLKKIIRFSVK